MEGDAGTRQLNPTDADAAPMMLPQSLMMLPQSRMSR